MGLVLHGALVLLNVHLSENSGYLDCFLQLSGNEALLARRRVPSTLSLTLNPHHPSTNPW